MGIGFDILILVVLIIIFFVLPKLIRTGMNKGVDAVQNAMKEKQEKENPPERKKL